MLAVAHPGAHRGPEWRQYYVRIKDQDTELAAKLINPTYIDGIDTHEQAIQYMHNVYPADPDCRRFTIIDDYLYQLSDILIYDGNDYKTACTLAIKHGKIKTRCVMDRQMADDYILDAEYARAYLESADEILEELSRDPVLNVSRKRSVSRFRKLVVLWVPVWHAICPRYLVRPTLDEYATTLWNRHTLKVAFWMWAFVLYYIGFTIHYFFTSPYL